MICEKCGKKISDKKPYCDHCNHPVVYSEFSKLEYEKAAPQVEMPARTTINTGNPRYVQAPPQKKKSSSSPILAVIIVLVAVMAAVWLATPKSSNKNPFMNDSGKTTSPSNEVTVAEEEPEETKNPAQPYLQILNDCDANDKYMLCNIGDEVQGLVIKSGNDYKVYAVANGTTKEIAAFNTEKLFKENEFETLLYSDGNKYYEITKYGKREKEHFNELMATQISDSEFVSVGNTSKIDNYNKEN
ncbi:MAG: zinc ribbon domain-containing protein [Clostridia bacterium]|nr:zinc ribbon domain-containing protein [Clostridia bacterium]